jgi:DNA-directed RNA polymerase alpha subunit
MTEPNRPKRRHRPRLDSDVDDLGLTTRASNALYYAGIRTIADLLAHRPADLRRKVWNIGYATLNVIVRAVRRARFSWKD